MLDELEKGEVYLVMTFADQTAQVALTTLNPEILAELGAQPVKDFYFDLKKRQYVRFRDDVVDYSIHLEPPKFKVEVIEFATRFL